MRRSAVPRAALGLFAVAAVLVVLAFPTSPPARDDVRWTGTVRLLGGHAARGPGVVRLFDARGPDHAVAVPYGPDGRFDARVPPGEYEALLEPAGEDREPVALAGTLRFGDEDVARDVAFPAGIVRGRVTGSVPQVDPRGLPRGALSRVSRLSLSHAGDVLLQTQSTGLSADGSFHMDGVRLGRYFVGGFMDDDVEPVIAEVSADRPDVELELRR